MIKRIKGALPQTTTRGYEKICEEYTLENVILEIAQNAFEHGNAPLCEITYWCDEKGVPNISFFNNGKPMTDAIFREFISKYHCHNTTNSTPSANGTFTSLKGYGFKDAILYCCSEYGISEVTFKNYFSNGKLTEWSWRICKTNGDNGSYDADIKVSTYSASTHPVGLYVHVSNSRYFTETELSKAQKNIARTFSTEAISSEKTIQLSWKHKKASTIRLYDPMHFEMMPLPDGKTIYNCEEGEYISDDVIWFVREGKFRGENPAIKEIVDVPVRVICEYINEPTYKKKYPKTKCFDEISTTNAGIFPLYGQVYLEIGNNIRGHFGGSDNGGGAPRLRICPIITNENAFLWNIRSIKNAGITPFDTNPLLCECFKRIEDDGFVSDETLYEFLHNTYRNIRSFHSNVIKANKDSKEGDYYGKNGFTDREKILKDISDFKSGSAKTNKHIKESNLDNTETWCPLIIPEDPSDVLYTLNKKCDIISKVISNNGIKHSLNMNAVGIEFNEATKEDILYSVFDTLEEMKVDPSIYHRLAELLPTKIRHYEE